MGTARDEPTTGAAPWEVLESSSRGAAHDTSGLPNQDAHAWRTLEELNGPIVVAAVADGHGHPRHFRAERGAHLAVEQACRCAAQLGAGLAGLASAAELDDFARQTLVPTVTRSWRDAVSALFTASVTGFPRRLSMCARSRSAAVISLRPSTRKMMCEAVASATSAWRRIWLGMYSWSSTTIPPVSITSKRRPRCSAGPYMRSRVIPGSSPTMARRCPVIRLKSVDFPTLGRPTMTTVGVVCDMNLHNSSRTA